MKRTRIKMPCLIATSLLFLIPFCTAGALYNSSDDVILLTASDFNEVVLDSPDLWFVHFGAFWSGHCKHLSTSWKKLARILKGIVKFGYVEYTEDPSLFELYDVTGYPTKKIFGFDKKNPTYTYEWKVATIIDVALDHLKTLVNDRYLAEENNGESAATIGAQNPVPSEKEMKAEL